MFCIWLLLKENLSQSIFRLRFVLVELQMLNKWFVKTLAKQEFAIVLDVGTTGIKAFVFREDYSVVAKSYRSIKEIKLHPRHVEQDPLEIIRLAKEVIVEAFQLSKIPINQFAGIGITNQRETVIAWDKKTSWPFYPAIVWKDSRTWEKCVDLRQKYGDTIRQKTGLSMLPYFSASKISWLLENNPEIKLAHETGCLGVGTVDSWLIWNLSEEQNYSTDITNAGRTLLFDVRKRQWDKELFDIFGIPENLMPTVKKSRENYGMLKKEILGVDLPILAVCGDQQASLFAVGQAIGTTKITYGTGTFVMQIIGDQFALHDGYFTTLTADGTFAVEAKMDRGAKEVDKLLNDQQQLTTYLKSIATEVDVLIKSLPIIPDEIIIDGGVMRDGIVGKLQEEISEIKIVPQKMFDGTALGTAKLVFNQ